LLWWGTLVRKRQGALTWSVGTLLIRRRGYIQDKERDVHSPLERWNGTEEGVKRECHNELMTEGLKPN